LRSPPLNHVYSCFLCLHLMVCRSWPYG
jgi:hypothetical protein